MNFMLALLLGIVFLKPLRAGDEGDPIALDRAKRTPVLIVPSKAKPVAKATDPTHPKETPRLSVEATKARVAFSDPVTAPHRAMEPSDGVAGAAHEASPNPVTNGPTPTAAPTAVAVEVPVTIAPTPTSTLTPAPKAPTPSKHQPGKKKPKVRG